MIVTVDIQKAFVSSAHSSIWSEVGCHSIGQPSVQLLKKTHDGQTAEAMTGAEGDELKMETITTQRDSR